VAPAGPVLHVATTSNILLDALFADFAKPHGLPPPRSCDHNIALLPRSQPVATHSYRYPASHKDKLEQHCTAILEQGLIHRSSSTFSSQAIQKRAYDLLHLVVAYATGAPASLPWPQKGNSSHALMAQTVSPS